MPTRPEDRPRDDGSVETVHVPKGIDPGWATNPGKSRGQTLMQSLTGKLETAGPEVARAAIAQLWSGPAQTIAETSAERVAIPVAVSSPELQSVMGSKAALVFLGPEEARRKVKKHGDQAHGMGFTSFGLIQAVLAQNEIVQRRDKAATFVGVIDGDAWEVVVKQTATDELVISTFFPLVKRRIDTLRARAAQTRETHAGGGS